MQRLPSELLEARLRCLRKEAHAGLKARTIDSIIQDWMSDMGKVHTDLVRTAGLEHEAQ